MPAVFQLLFLPEGTTLEFFGSRGNYYEWEDGLRMDLQSRPAWCRGCRDYTDSEWIESLDEIDRQLVDLHDPNSELYRLTKNTSSQRPKDHLRRLVIEKTKHRRQWREQRASPARCLLCGSTDIVALPDNEEIPNPNGTGTVRLSVTGLCSTQFNEWYFTPEGIRIERVTKPTYWALPG